MLKKILFGLVIVSVILLRLVYLGEIPRGINVDEAVYGYDAYSLLKTGSDIWGNRSATLYSFGDNKPAGLAWVLIPLVKYLGLSTTTTRLPSALFGLGTLIFLYLTSKLIYPNKQTAAILTVISALSPWHFALGRLFYEVNIGLFFLSVAIYALLLHSRELSIKYLYIAAVSLALSGYFYAVFRYFGIFLLIYGMWINHVLSRKHIQKLLKVLLVWCIFALPYMGSMFGSTGFTRAKQENKLHTFGDTLVINENRQMCYLMGNNPLITKYCYILWNKPAEKLVGYFETYIKSLSANYLFLNSFQKDVTPQGNGAFVSLMIIPFLLGMFRILKSRTGFAKHYVLMGLLVAPIPIALARSLNIHRNVIGLFFVTLVIGYGLDEIINLIGKIHTVRIKQLLIVSLAMIFIFFQSRYISYYFFVFTRFNNATWQTDIPALMKWLGANKADRAVYVENMEFAPLYSAFYNLIDPIEFKKTAIWSSPDEFGWRKLVGLEGNFYTIENTNEIICDSSSKDGLVVISPNKEYTTTAKFEIRDDTGVNILRQVVDVEKLRCLSN